MKFKLRKTTKIKKLVAELETLKNQIENLSMPPNVEENLRQEALLKSALHSASIEGNPLAKSIIQKLKGNGRVK